MVSVTALDQASQRLSQAFSSLEARIQARQETDVEAASQLEGMQEELVQEWKQTCEKLTAENAALLSERDELACNNEVLRNELHALKQDFVELQDLNEQIAARVDEQVSQLELIAG